MSGKIVIRPSSIGRWMGCQRKAWWEMWNRTPDELATHVGSWIGSCVHDKLAGRELAETPDIIKFDKTTPNIARAEKQIDQIAEAIDLELGELGWTILENEWEFRETQILPDVANIVTSGTADLIMEIPELAVCDVKTGGNTDAAWLQLGAYGKLMQQDFALEVEKLAVIRAKRQASILTDVNVEIEIRDAGPVMDDAWRIIQILAETLTGDGDLLPRPNAWTCSICVHPDCPVRANRNQEKG